MPQRRPQMESEESTGGVTSSGNISQYSMANTGHRAFDVPRNTATPWPNWSAFDCLNMDHGRRGGHVSPCQVGGGVE